MSSPNSSLGVLLAAVDDGGWLFRGPGTTSKSHFQWALAVLKQKAQCPIPVSTHRDWRGVIQKADNCLIFVIIIFWRRVAEQIERNGTKLNCAEEEFHSFILWTFFFFCTRGSSIGWNNYETWNLSSCVVGNYKIALFNYVVFYRRAFLTFVTSAQWKETQLFVISIITLIASKVYVEAIHF